MTNLVKTEFGYYRADPVPSDAELHDWYSKKYYSSVHPEMYRKENAEEREWLARECRWAAEDLLRLRPEARTSGLLDIGCGPAYLMAEMHRRGFAVTGIDPDPGAAAHYNPDVAGAVSAGSWQDIVNEPGPSYDWINLSGVLEHVRDPSQTVESLKQRLAPGGVVRISVPNDFNVFQKAIQANGLAKDQYWVNPPEHLSYFSLESLTRLVEFHGFELLYSHGDFPIDMFLLMGRDYTRTPEVGEQCHFERMRFEAALEDETLRKIYAELPKLGIGRTLTIYISVA